MAKGAGGTHRIALSVEAGGEGMSMRDRVLEGIRNLGLPLAVEVGGSLRDELLGREPKDVDIAAGGVTFQELHRLCARHGRVTTNTVRGRDIGVRLTAEWTPPEGVEISLLRREHSTGPRHQDFEITPFDPPQELAAMPIRERGKAGAAWLRQALLEDLKRRDFTCNAIARDVQTGERFDPFGGAEDLRAGVLRVVSPESFRDDPLRMYRLLVRMAHDGSRPDEETVRLLHEWMPSLLPADADDPASMPIPQEAIYAELDKVLRGPHAAEALRFARDLGLLSCAVPELEDAIGFEQMSRYHDLTCDEHILMVVQRACEFGASQQVRWAALLHDAGKPASAWMGADGRLHYYANPDYRESQPAHTLKEGDRLADEPSPVSALQHQGERVKVVLEDAQRRVFRADEQVEVARPKRSHEQIGAELAAQALRRLRAPRKDIEQVEFLVRNHMFSDDRNFLQLNPDKRARRARRFIARVGRERVEDLLMLRRCDRAGKRLTLSAGWDEEIAAFEEEVRAQMHQPLTVGELAIDARRLRDELGLEGPAIGETLRELLKRVIDHPEHNQPERLWQWAKTIARRKHAERLHAQPDLQAQAS